MKQRLGNFIILFLLLSPAVLPAQEFEIVILHGRVMAPETEFDEVANVGISNGWIFEISNNEIKGKETIDARIMLSLPVSLTPNNMISPIEVSK